jgi:hypothetical protein
MMLLQWIPVIVVLCAPVAVFVGRNWLKEAGPWLAGTLHDLTGSYSLAF